MLYFLLFTFDLASTPSVDQRFPISSCYNISFHRIIRSNALAYCDTCLLWYLQPTQVSRPPSVDPLRSPRTSTDRYPSPAHHDPQHDPSCDSRTKYNPHHRESLRLALGSILTPVSIFSNQGICLSSNRNALSYPVHAPLRAPPPLHIHFPAPLERTLQQHRQSWPILSHSMLAILRSIPGQGIYPIPIIIPRTPRLSWFVWSVLVLMLVQTSLTNFATGITSWCTKHRRIVLGTNVNVISSAPFSSSYSSSALP